MKEAMLYESLDEKTVKCKVCNHYCLIRDGDRGVCGVRENRDGKLFALNYGKTIASAIDPIEKKPIFHFLPRTRTYSFATVGCNFKCLWCQNSDISQYSKRNTTITGYEVSVEEHVDYAIINNCKSISYTYSEPTIFLEYAYDVMKYAKEKGLYNIWVSNGYMSSETLELILPLVDAFNIDFKGFNDQIHKEYCGGSVKPIMNNLKTIYHSKTHLEITTLVIPNVNDDYYQLAEIANFIASSLGKEVPWHISRFFPAWKMRKTPPTPISKLKEAKRIGEGVGLKHIYLGNV
jgi:pyruvate formate lyase activating enzyme